MLQPGYSRLRPEPGMWKVIYRAAALTPLVFIALLAFLQTHPAHAQSPVPTAFMRNVNPGSTPPADGADVLVVEGLGGGLGGCPPALNTTAFVTISAINAGRRTITEISVQSGCDPDPQHWKNLLLELVTNVENSAPNSGTLWGGVMLNEESAWGTPAFFADINNSLAYLMSSIRPNGMSWYYTETFSGQGVSGQGDWSQADFDGVTGLSVAAPELATTYMAQLITTRQASTHENVLVTWSLNRDYLGSSRIGVGLYEQQSAVSGAPYHPLLWGKDYSNCFTNGNDPCYIRNHKADANFDGYSAADEVTVANCGLSSCGAMSAFGTGETMTCKDPGKQCGTPNPPADDNGPARTLPGGSGYGCLTTLDTVGPLKTTKLAQSDIDLDGVVSVLDLAKVASWFGNPVDPNPSDPRWEGNMDGDGTISILDLVAMAANYGRSVSNNCKLE